jgi:predicted ester cyclase
MTRKQTHLVDVTTKMKKILTRTFVRNKSRIALGMVVTAAAVTGGLATAGSNATAQRAPRHHGQPTNVAANKNVVRAFLKDVLAEHHGDHAARYFTPDAQFHAGTVGTITGNTNIGGALSGIVTAVPDLHPALQDMFGQGNEVVVRLVVTGTQTGNLLGIPPSGRPLRWDAVDVYQLKDGKISQEWAAEDLTAILNDTGTYKAPWIQ